MKITIFTSNQPRHLFLAKRLAAISEEVYCIQECNTVFPGQIDDFYMKSDVMQKYFSSVINAEDRLFGKVTFSPKNVRTLCIKNGDLNKLERGALECALLSDIYIVFGASYIKGWLIDFLVSKGTINIHMGLSPYYRGASCNFWALYDGNASYVGATIHKLSKGLDSGPMLYHCLPKYEGENSFLFTMKSVDVAQKSLVDRISNKQIFDMEPIPQDKSLEVRYARNSCFTNEVANEFLNQSLNLKDFNFEYPDLLRPYFG
jgi:folate-dependent phosphoribosylglycinamide formyltransferase PurN